MQISTARGLRRRRARLARTAVLYASVIGFALWILLPLWFTLQSSLSSIGGMQAIPPRWLPTGLTLDNYATVVTGEVAGGTQGSLGEGAGAAVLRAILMSGIVGAVVAGINIVVAGIAGYAYSRYRFVGWRAGYGFLLISRVVPGIVLIVPFFVAFRVLGLIGSPLALIISYNVITLPLAVWLMKGYFDALPPDIEEAAIVDGASKLQVIWHIAVPLARPALVAVGLLVFLESWSEFFYALVLTSQLTVPPLLAMYNTFLQFNWSTLSAAICVALILPMLLAMVFQRYIVSGLTAGSTK